MKTRRHTSYAAMAALPLVVVLVMTASVNANDNANAETATYSVVFVPSWNPASHPEEYPVTHAKQGLLTPIIGATHGSGYRLFGDGLRPSVGLETLSETGMPTPLDHEIHQAIKDGTATSVIAFADGSPGPVHEPVMNRFEVGRSQPLVSLVGMIAPSPDWFYGVSAVNLRDGGQWVTSVHVEAYAWDSGGDAGTTYMAEDMDLDPKQPTTRVDTRHFFQNGQRTPVGVFIFKRIPTSH